MVAVPTQFMRGAVAAWLASSEVMLDGQLGVAIHPDGLAEIKFGNGSDEWSGLNGLKLNNQVTYVLDFGSIAAHTTSDLAFTATGVVVGHDVTTHSTNLETGLVPYASVTAADTITLRLANITAAAINPVARTWRFRVWR